jgi:glutaredoxin
MRISILWVFVFILAIVSLASLTGYFTLKPKPSPRVCEVSEMTWYYADWCPYCRRVKQEGTIQKLRGLGVEVTEINIEVGPIMHEFRGVPAFVVAGRVYEGYRTFEQLKELLRC